MFNAVNGMVPEYPSFRFVQRSDTTPTMIEFERLFRDLSTLTLSRASPFIYPCWQDHSSTIP